MEPDFSKAPCLDYAPVKDQLLSVPCGQKAVAFQWAGPGAKRTLRWRFDANLFDFDAEEVETHSAQPREKNLTGVSPWVPTPTKRKQSRS